MATDVMNHSRVLSPDSWDGLPAAYSQGRFSVVERELDFSKDTFSADDLISIFNVPKGSFVVGVGLEVITPVSTPAAGVTFDAGDYTPVATPVSEGDAITIVDANGFLVSVDAHTAAKKFSAPGNVDAAGTPHTVTPAYGFGKFYTADSIIGLLVSGGAPANGRLKLTLVGFLATPRAGDLVV